MNGENENQKISLAEKNVASHKKESHYFKIMLIVVGVLLIVFQILAYSGTAKRAELSGEQHEVAFNSLGIAEFLGSNISGIFGIILVIIGIVGLFRNKKQPK